jgi:hypothetical protein
MAGGTLSEPSIPLSWPTPGVARSETQSKPRVAQPLTSRGRPLAASCARRRFVDPGGVCHIEIVRDEALSCCGPPNETGILCRVTPTDLGPSFRRFIDYDLGYFNLETRVLEPLENPFGPKVLPM